MVLSDDHHNNCLELTFEHLGNVVADGDNTDDSHAPIDWKLDDERTTTLAYGTIGSNETFARACFNETFECAGLQAFLMYSEEHNQITNEYGTFRAVWDGVVWADQHPYILPTSDPFIPLLWIGDGCYKHQFEVCEYNEDTWVLDVELTTAIDANEEAVYWRVYSDMGGNSRGNLLRDPYFRYYQPNTTYHSLQCIENSAGCTELGLKNWSSVTDFAVRVNGQEKTDRWNCHKDLCDGDIVTPLRGCSYDDSLSAGAIAGIVIACVVSILGLLMLVVWQKSKRQSKEGQSEPEQPLEQQPAT